MDNGQVISSSSFNVYKIDNTEPIVSIEIPDKIISNSEYKLPTSYTLGQSGGSVSCKIGDDIITTTKNLEIGEYQIVCSVTTTTGKTSTVSKNISVVFGKLFDYTGAEQTLTIPETGIYMLETWGAQGESASSTYIGGYGGYSTGYVKLTSGQTLYINIGGTAGYNGGGTGSKTVNNGGGATHIATQPGLLAALSDKPDTILIVSGGGGGSINYGSASPSGSGGNAGGFTGSNGKYGGWTSNAGGGGTQIVGGISGLCGDGSICGMNGSFGQGGNVYQCSTSNCDKNYQAGGGGGFYGGGSARHAGGGGGSSYIGNILLTNKVMYCYNCEESNDEATKTISTTNVSEDALPAYAKKGNGYAKITYVGEE